MNVMAHRLSTEESAVLTAIDKTLVARSFGMAAETYDQLAGLQKEVGLGLLDAFPRTGFTDIADIGCGTGWLTRHLRENYPQAQITGVDLAEGMIRHARKHQADAADRWLVGDMEEIPLATASQDLVYSSLAMQWLDEPQQWFAEVDRILRPGGCFVASTLLDGTLYELASSWAFADRQLDVSGQTSHVNTFVTQQMLQQQAARVLPGARVEAQTRVRWYDSVRDIMKELKGIGAHNLNADRPKGITGKSRIRQMMAHYEEYRGEQGLPTTYIVGVITYRKPACQTEC